MHRRSSSNNNECPVILRVPIPFFRTPRLVRLRGTYSRYSSSVWGGEGPTSLVRPTHSSRHCSMRSSSAELHLPRICDRYGHTSALRLYVPLSRKDVRRRSDSLPCTATEYLVGGVIPMVMDIYIFVTLTALLPWLVFKVGNHRAPTGDPDGTSLKALDRGCTIVRARPDYASALEEDESNR